MAPSATFDLHLADEGSGEEVAVEREEKREALERDGRSVGERGRVQNSLVCVCVCVCEVTDWLSVFFKESVSLASS